MEGGRGRISGARGRANLEADILAKVGEVISAIHEAKHVDQIICALHSLALLLFPVDASLFSGTLDQQYRNQVLNASPSTQSEMGDWRHTFYHGAAFPTLARVLMFDVASNWLACFPLSARTHIYDSFIVNGPSSETIPALVPYLMENSSHKDLDLDSICSNAERLLVLCLLESEGVRHMAREFGERFTHQGLINEGLRPDNLTCISMAQLVASIPDKARPKASIALSSHMFFKKVAAQLLAVGVERARDMPGSADSMGKTALDGTFVFIGEMFSRICRRGSADVLVAQMIYSILIYVWDCLSSNIDHVYPDLIESKPESQFWLKMVEAMKDHYAVERLSEELLRQLAATNVSDTEAYWVLWLLFHQSLKHQTAVRAMFVDKFLLWRVFPICCLRWILQFSILKCPPYTDLQREGRNTGGLIDIVQRLVGTWSKREFVQSTSMEQQAYVTAAVGLSLEKMYKEELEASKDVLHPLLQGVSCRLESPIHLVRKMASYVALTFSKVLDPKNPLYLDDDCREDKIDWEFGFTTLQKRVLVDSRSAEIVTDELKKSSDMSEKEQAAVADQTRQRDVKEKGLSNIEFPEFQLVNPDEIVDPATLNNGNFPHEDVDDDESLNSEDSDDSSLQPYDLSDDYADLKKKFSQLTDVIAALRKPDKPDGVEGALDVAESLVRASPDELRHVAGDLARALMQVRCSDVAVEGEEESAEDKRQRALVALLVMSPFESLDSLTNLLYSPNIDVSQRILILDVMTDAAQELADTKVIGVKDETRRLISTVSEGQQWFIPSSRGPPGAGPWKEISETGTPLSYYHCYERELPSKPTQAKMGKSRRWSLQSKNTGGNQVECLKNKFPFYAAAFMLPAMQGFDKKRHGVDLLGRDSIVLGKLIHMLGVCIKCTAMHPEASALVPALLDMLSSRAISHHKEAYVRRSVLFAASCILIALHPSYVASALVEGNQEISRGLEWMRTWALHVAESDPDAECSALAMTCLKLHSEMALQASRSLESRDHLALKGSGASDVLRREIIMPYSNMPHVNL